MNSKCQLLSSAVPLSGFTIRQVVFSSQTNYHLLFAFLVFLCYCYFFPFLLDFAWFLAGLVFSDWVIEFLEDFVYGYFINGLECVSSWITDDLLKLCINIVFLWSFQLFIVLFFMYFCVRLFVLRNVINWLKPKIFRLLCSSLKTLLIFTYKLMISCAILECPSFRPLISHPTPAIFHPFSFLIALKRSF